MRLSLTVLPPDRSFGLRALMREVAAIARRAWPRREPLDDVPEFEGELTPREKQEQAIRDMVRRTMGDGF